MLVILYFFADWFQAAYDGILFPLIGLIFAPLTCIWYAVVLQFFGGDWSLWPIVGMVIAVGLDFGLIGNSARGR